MRIAFFIFLIGLGSVLGLQAEMREWTSADGRKLQATILGLEGETVRLETSKGKFELSVSKFSKADQDYIKEWAEKQKTAQPAAPESESGKKTAPELGNFEGIKLGVWPQYVEADLPVEKIITVDSKEQGEFVYRTPHFEFVAPDRLSASVIREFARIFEATYVFVDQMPIGLAPQPSANGFYQTKLYMTKEAYFSDGGMPGSGGQFSWQRRGNEMSGMIKVPLPNLGVEYTGTRFIVDHNKRSTTLTHEIVHQVMMRWLATAMPVWLSEGIAEVVSSQDYNNGRFKLNSMSRAIAEEVTRNSKDFDMVKLDKLMTISHEDWSSDLASGSGGRNYNSASVLAYYFLKLDGAGDGAHLVEFLKAITSGNRGDGSYAEAQTKHLLRDRSFEVLQDDLAKAWRSEGLKITF
jgi:hypothetical protein